MKQKGTNTVTWEFPVEGEIANWEMQRAIGTIRVHDPRYKTLVPAWPSLALGFEKDLAARISQSSGWLARRYARMREARAKSHSKPDDYLPPTSAEELKLRIAAGESYFAGAQLDCEDLSGAALMGCNFSNGTFRNVKFNGADLSQADLSAAIFSEYPDSNGPQPTDFSDAILEEADFSGSDIVGAVGLEFDNNYIKDVRISDRPTDAWSKLKDRYTAFSSFVTILFSALYFLPVIFTLLLWYTVGGVQEFYPEFVARLTDLINVRSGSSFDYCPSDDCVTTWSFVAAILITPNGIKFAGLAIALFVYNVLRVRVTNGMSKWQNGVRANWTPSIEAVRSMRRFDWIIRFISITIVLPLAIVTFGPIMVQEVSLPRSIWPFE
jgi:Pentapeptide repeats (8 copies)